jgi:hypothetical protein
MMFQPKSNGMNARKICLHISDAESPADKFRFTKDIASSSDVVKFINRLAGESLSQFNLLVENIESAIKADDIEAKYHSKIFLEQALADFSK